jgi:subtilisin family serine protease
VPVAQPAPQSQAYSPGLSASSALVGEPPPGGTLDGGEPEPEPEVLVFRDIVLGGETYRIVDGRVLVGFTNPPEPPQYDPNYYDVERSDHDPLMMELCPIVEDIPAVAAFIQAENLTVYCDWPPAKAIAVILPEGTTVEDAVSNWPTEYPDLIESVEPDYAVDLHSGWPSDPPNDDYWFAYWELDESNLHDINIQQAWRTGYLGYPSEVIAVVDTGVQRSYPDLVTLATPYGINCGTAKWSMSCTYHGGEPNPWSYNQNSLMAMIAGHGTCVAGIACASINNDGNGIWEDGDSTCGITYANRFLPVAMDLVWDQQVGPVFTDTTVCNALMATLIAKRICWNFLQQSWPYYNVEVVNCSFGGTAPRPYTEWYLMNWLSRYAVIVASSGNDGRHDAYAVYPAAYGEVMCIAGHDAVQLWTHSNYPIWTDLIAPATVIAPDMTGFNSHGDALGFAQNPYAFTWPFSGTSAAAPHVSAVAAMMASAHRDWTPAQIWSSLCASAIHDLPGDHYHKGRLNAYGALVGQ